MSNKLNRLIAPAIVLALAGLANAQSTTNTGPKKEQPVPMKSIKPADDSKQPAKPTKDTEATVTLKAGDKAPAINVEKWVQGEAVTGFEKGKVYIVEFWATWCPPCQKSIPHLTELQKEHKGLTVIGVTSSERKDKDGADNRIAKLEAFVKAKGDAMKYTVGYEGDYEMFKQWMTPAGRNGIPSAFIVGGDGIISWIGNPLDKSFDGEVEKALKAAKGGAKKDANKETNKDTNKDTKKDPKNDNRK